MTARNGGHGYGWVTKVLHWATLGLIVAQFVVGYLMADDDGGHRKRTRAGWRQLRAGTRARAWARG